MKMSPITNGLRLGRPRGLTVPDLDEGVVHRSAGASIHDSKVHEKFYSSIKIVVIRRAEPSYVITEDCLLL